VDAFIGRLVAGCRGRVVPLVVGVALAGCAGENPASPSASDGEGPQLERADQAAAARFPISVSPKSVRLNCPLNGFCETPVALSAFGEVSYDWSVEGFTVNSANSNCDGSFDLSNSSCVITVVAFTSEPGRQDGIMTITDRSTGTTKTVRLTARVS
jgi:hypothetical protein